MITIHWGLIATAIIANAIVAVALILQISTGADRRTQQEGQYARTLQWAISEGLKTGHKIYLSMYAEQTKGKDDQ